MSKGPGPISALLPITLVNAIQRLGGRGKGKIALESSAKQKSVHAKQKYCSYCTAERMCKHCRNWTKIAQRWMDREDRKRIRKAQRAEKPVPA